MHFQLNGEVQSKLNGGEKHFGLNGKHNAYKNELRKGQKCLKEPFPGCTYLFVYVFI